jgi:hypothetical protein
VLGLLAALVGCEEPPPKRVDRVDPPVLEGDREEAEQFRRRAHEQGLAAALPLALAALQASDPLGTWQAGRGPAAIPIMTLGQQAAIVERVDAAQLAIDEINEAYLPPSSVVILRAVQFGLTRLADELERRPRARQDPTVPLRAVEAVLDELVYRLLQDDCDATCESLAAELATALPESRAQLVAASTAATRRSGLMATTLAQRSRELATRPLLERHATLRAGLEQLAVALDEQRDWLDGLHERLSGLASERTWKDKPPPIRPGGSAAIERMPDVLGVQALSRRLASEELVILDPEADVARVANHVRRWDALRRELVGDAAPSAASSQGGSPIDVPRCEAALDRIRAGLANVEGVEPPRLSCDRYVELLGGRELDEGALVIELLDYGVIEPQRRALRNAELPEIAAVTGQWSPSVHTHLRRVMLLARLDEPAARARAIEAGSQALCLAEASLWVHAELGLPNAVRDAIGSKCAALGDAEAILELVLGDARGALAGFGLSLIGDEPARMVGFDRFFWAPLGLMQTLATPIGMHPDQFTLPDDPSGGEQRPKVDVKVEPLTPRRDEDQ